MVIISNETSDARRLAPWLTMSRISCMATLFEGMYLRKTIWAAARTLPLVSVSSKLDCQGRYHPSWQRDTPNHRSSLHYQMIASALCAVATFAVGQGLHLTTDVYRLCRSTISASIHRVKSCARSSVFSYRPTKKPF